MRLIAYALLVLVIAAAIGLGLTWATASRGTNFGTLTIGAWTARPKIGTSDINPYTRASVARNGELPLAAGDGIAFAAKADDTARPLDGRCDVTVSGVTPPARFWTLTLYDLKGQLIANGLQRYGFTSEDFFNYVNEQTGQNWTPFFDQYFRYPGIPTLEYTLTGKGKNLIVKYRWLADVPGFNMPVLVGNPGNMTRIQPTREWQETVIKDLSKSDFEVATDLFYIKTKG